MAQIELALGKKAAETNGLSRAALLCARAARHHRQGAARARAIDPESADDGLE